MTKGTQRAPLGVQRSVLLPNDWIDMPDHMHFGRFYFSIPIYFFNDEFDCGKVNLMAKLEFDNGPENHWI